MTASGKAIRRIFFRMWPRHGGSGPLQEYVCDEQPLRDELFSADQMEQHGKVLASMHQVKPGRPRDRLLARLAENEILLLDVHRLVTEAVKADRRITPAGEWLLDNFYVIEEQIRTARRHLPKGYSRELPRLGDGPSAGLPRVYDIALETIAHGDGRVDPENLSRFVVAYQSVTPLTLGELWAIPIMLRLALIENLRRVAARIAADRLDRNRADYWADQMTEIAAKDPTSLILAIADMARSNPPMASSFVAELARRLQGQGPALALPLTWIEQRLSESGLTIEAAGALGEPAAGRRPGLDEQQHRQPALSRRDGLARVRRDDERRRADPERGSRRRVRPDGLRHAGPLPPRRGEDGEAQPARRDRGGAPGDPARARGRGTRGRRRPRGPRRLLPDRRGPAAARTKRRRCAVSWLSFCKIGGRASWPLYVGAILLLTAVRRGA